MTWLGEERRSNGDGLSEEQIALIANAAARQAVEIIRKKYSEETGSMKRLLAALLLMVVLGMAGGGWGASEFLHTKFAGKEEVIVAGAKADYLIERREEALVREIAELERSTRELTPTQRTHLENLRKQLEEARKVRRGK